MVKQPFTMLKQLFVMVTIYGLYRPSHAPFQLTNQIQLPRFWVVIYAWAAVLRVSVFVTEGYFESMVVNKA